MKEIIVIDCQNDFISGPLACKNSNEVLKSIINFIDNNNSKVYYTCDWHTKNNKSFKTNGGIWEEHCVQGTKGAEVSDKFKNLKQTQNIPNNQNTYKKGIDDNIEEYSAYKSKNFYSKVLNEVISEEIYICGIASEYCVRQTALDFLKSGTKVYLIKNAIGYMDYFEHIKNLKDLEKMGAILL